MNAGTRGALRAALFLVLAVVVVGAPSYRMVFHQREPNWVPRWVMFSGKGLDLFEVRFEQAREDGSRERIDYLSLLGYERFYSVPRGLRRLTKMGQVERLGMRVCKHVQRNAGRPVPVYARVRDATRSGWRTVNDGSRDICQRPEEAAP